MISAATAAFGSPEIRMGGAGELVMGLGIPADPAPEPLLVPVVLAPLLECDG